MSAPFTKLVRKAVDTHLPDYRFFKLTKGSGPVLMYQRPIEPAWPCLCEIVGFQKGSYGADWFRVYFWPEFEGAIKGGKSGRFTLGSNSMKVVSYKNQKELVNWLNKNMGRVDKEASRYFGLFRKEYKKLDNLYGQMIAWYKQWYDKRAGEFSPKDFTIAADENKKPIDRCPAYQDFEKFLKTKKLIPKGDALWQFWHDMRPMRREEYVKGDYHDCSVCNKFLSRGTQVAKRDPVFGHYYEFVCAKCAKKSGG